MSLHAMAPDGHTDHEVFTPVFVGARRAELDELLTRYPTKMAALLPALWMLQESRGWVSPDGMEEVATVLELTPAYVKGVVTFYTCITSIRSGNTSCRSAPPRPATCVVPRMS